MNGDVRSGGGRVSRRRDRAEQLALDLLAIARADVDVAGHGQLAEEARLLARRAAAEEDRVRFRLLELGSI